MRVSSSLTIRTIETEVDTSVFFMYICNMMTYIMIYIVGFILSILFWVKFHKRLGIDFDVPKTYVNYDDWDSNGSAFLFFSLMWPIVLPMGLLIGGYALGVFCVQYLIEKFG